MRGACDLAGRMANTIGGAGAGMIIVAMLAFALAETVAPLLRRVSS